MLCKCLLLVAITVASATENYSDCPTSLSTLERALYDTEDNLVQLNRIFFPRSTRTSRFVKVVYTFQDDPDLLYDYSNCRNVTFFWAIGSFLFFQPPSIFSFTSLFFNYPNNNINDLKLTLPNECKPLIYSEETQECTCRVNHDTAFHHSTELLHILTQQLDTYSRFTVRDNIDREHTFAREVCSENLYEAYYSGSHGTFIYSLISSTIILPLTFAIIFVLSSRNLKQTTVNHLTKSTYHRRLVALSYVGILLSLAIFVIDIVACYYVTTSQHEYAEEITEPSVNLYIVYITLILDSLFILPSFLCMLYIFWINITGCVNRKMSTSGKFIRGFLMILIGKRSFEKIEAKCDNEVVAFIFPVLLTSPLLCITSHLGYILLAWVTEPSKSSATLVLYYLIVVFFYIAIQKFYTLHEKTHLKLWNHRRAKVVINKEANPEETNVVIANKSRDSVVALEESVKNVAPIKRNHNFRCLYVIRLQKDHINPQAFCFLVFYSLIVLGMTMLIMFIFLLLPISSENLLTYLFNALQLLVVFITTQIAFKLFFSSSFNLREAVKSFREHLIVQKNEEEEEVDGQVMSIVTDKTIGLEKATGAVVAEFTNMAVHDKHVKSSV